MNQPTFTLAPYEPNPACRELTISLHELAQISGVSPRLLERFAVFAVVESFEDAGGNRLFPVSQLPRLARGVRLRRDLRIGVPALGLVLDLLERVERLEEELVRLHKAGR